MAVRVRENTFKIDLRNFNKRPTYEQIHDFVHGPLGLSVAQVIRLQMNHSQNCAHVKCTNLKTAQDTVIEHNERHDIEVNKKRTKVRLIMDDGGIEVKIHDLSENVRNEAIVTFLSSYGNVLSIKEEVWNEGFKYQGVISGVRIAKMVLRRHIKSFVTIQGEETLVTYRNQPQICRHCHSQLHPGNTCVENKKLLAQKDDLNQRLEAARGGGSGAKGTGNGSGSSYANVLAGPSTSGTSIFVPGSPGAILTQVKQISGITPASSLTTTPPNDPTSVPATTKDQQLDVAYQQAGSNAGTLGQQQTAERMEEGEIADNSVDGRSREIEQISSSSTPAADANADQPTQQPRTTQLQTTTSSGAVSNFKVPELLPASDPLNEEQISDVEMNDASTGASADDSSSEGAPFKKAKRGRGRPKRSI